MTQTAIPLPLYDEELPYRRRLFEENRPLALWIVNRAYSLLPPDDKEDARQEALYVLARAVKHYDPRRGHIVGLVNRSIRRHLRWWYTCYLRFGATGVRDSGTRYLPRGTFDKPVTRPVSLDAASGAVKETNVFADNLCDTRERPIEDVVDPAKLRSAVAKLPDSFRRIIEARFFEGRSLRDIADERRVSRQRVSEIEQAALKLLRVRYKNAEEFYQ